MILRSGTHDSHGETPVFLTSPEYGDEPADMILDGLAADIARDAKDATEAAILCRQMTGGEDLDETYHVRLVDLVEQRTGWTIA